MGIIERKIKHIKPEKEDFKDIKEGVGIKRTGRKREDIKIYNLRPRREELVQLLFPSDDPKKTIFRMGKLGRVENSKRLVPGTDVSDVSIYIKEGLERPEKIFDIFLYLEKKNMWQSIYVPNIIRRGVKFVYMEDDKKTLQKYVSQIQDVDTRIKYQSILDQYKRLK